MKTKNGVSLGYYQVCSGDQINYQCYLFNIHGFIALVFAAKHTISKYFYLVRYFLVMKAKFVFQSFLNIRNVMLSSGFTSRSDWYNLYAVAIGSLASSVQLFIRQSQSCCLLLFEDKISKNTKFLGISSNHCWDYCSDL